MAKRSIPAERTLTSEEAEKIAREMLEELRKIAPRGRSLIADEVDADFLGRVTSYLKSARKPIEHQPDMPRPTAGPLVDFACVEGEPLLQIKPGTDSRARLQLACDLLSSANQTLSRSNDAAEDLPWPTAGLVQHAVSTAEALLRSELEK